MASQFNGSRAGGSPRSPASGASSPGGLGGARGQRKAEAKKQFRAEVARLVEGVKLIPDYVRATDNLKREKVTVSFTANGQPQQYQVGRQEAKDYIAQIVKGLQQLPNKAFALNKGRRQTSPQAGFLAPAKFSQDMVNFFANANLGPQVTGQLGPKVDKAGNTKMVPDNNSLNAIPNSRLNNVLYFTQPNHPLYRVISPGTLTPLFALQSHYSNAQNLGTRSRLTATPEMRQYLGRIIQETIQNDVNKIATAFPSSAMLAQQAGQNALQALANPGLSVNTVVSVADPEKPTREVFNPNSFLYAHFSKLISTGKSRNEPVPLLNDAELAVLGDQQRQVAFARAYKNKNTAAADRQRKAAQKRAQQTA